MLKIGSGVFNKNKNKPDNISQITKHALRINEMYRSGVESINKESFLSDAADEISQLKRYDFYSKNWTTQFKSLEVIINNKTVRNNNTEKTDRAIKTDVLICTAETNKRMFAAKYRIVVNKDREYIDLFELIVYTDFKDNIVYLSPDFNIDYFVKNLKKSAFYYNKYMKAINKCNFVI